MSAFCRVVFIDAIGAPFQYQRAFLRYRGFSFWSEDGRETVVSFDGIPYTRKTAFSYWSDFHNPPNPFLARHMCAWAAICQNFNSIQVYCRAKKNEENIIINTQQVTQHSDIFLVKAKTLKHGWKCTKAKYQTVLDYIGIVWRKKGSWLIITINNAMVKTTLTSYPVRNLTVIYMIFI